MRLPTTRSVIAVALVGCAAGLILHAAPAGNHDLMLALFTGLLGWLTPSPGKPPEAGA